MLTWFLLGMLVMWFVYPLLKATQTTMVIKWNNLTMNKEEIKERLIKNDESIKNLIIKYNKIYKINNFSKFEKFNLKFFSLRNYYYKNICIFPKRLYYSLCLHIVDEDAKLKLEELLFACFYNI